MKEDTGLAVQGGGEAVQPTTSTRGRKGSLTAAAKRKAEQALEINGFNRAIADAQVSAKGVEAFSEELETVTADYCADRLAAVPHNIMTRVVGEVAGNDPADFSGFAHALRNTPAARNLYAFLQTSEGIEGE